MFTASKNTSEEADSLGTSLLPPPNGEWYVFISETHWRIFMKFSWNVGQEKIIWKNVRMCVRVCLGVFCECHDRKTDERIFRKFSGKIGHDTRNNREPFRMLWKTGERISMKFSWNSWRHKKLLSWLSHACLDCFTVSHLCARGGVSVNYIAVKGMNIFSLHFQDRSTMSWGKIWNISGWCD